MELEKIKEIFARKQIGEMLLLDCAGKLKRVEHLQEIDI